MNLTLFFNSWSIFPCEVFIDCSRLLLAGDYLNSVQHPLRKQCWQNRLRHGEWTSVSLHLTWFLHGRNLEKFWQCIVAALLPGLCSSMTDDHQTCDTQDQPSQQFSQLLLTSIFPLPSLAVLLSRKGPSGAPHRSCHPGSNPEVTRKERTRRKHKSRM